MDNPMNNIRRWNGLTDHQRTVEWQAYQEWVQDHEPEAVQSSGMKWWQWALIGMVTTVVILWALALMYSPEESAEILLPIETPLSTEKIDSVNVPQYKKDVAQCMKMNGYPENRNPEQEVWYDAMLVTPYDEFVAYSHTIRDQDLKIGVDRDIRQLRDRIQASTFADPLDWYFVAVYYRTPSKTSDKMYDIEIHGGWLDLNSCELVYLDNKR